MICISVYCKRGFQQSVADKGILITDFVLASIIPYIVQILIWRYIFDSYPNDKIFGFSESQLLFYYALAIALLRLNNGYDIIEVLSDSIREGSLEGHLVKPYPYPLQRLFEFVGGGFLYNVPFVIILVVQTVYNGIPEIDYTTLPLYIMYGCGFIFVFLSSQVICFLTSFLIGCFSFWFVRADAILSFIVLISSFFSREVLKPELRSEIFMFVFEANFYNTSISKISNSGNISLHI